MVVLTHKPVKTGDRPAFAVHVDESFVGMLHSVSYYRYRLDGDMYVWLDGELRKRDIEIFNLRDDACATIFQWETFLTTMLEKSVVIR